MDITTSATNGKAVLSLRGRFDFQSHQTAREAFKKAMVDANIKEIEFDLAAVDYIDSTALGTLLLCRINATDDGKVVSLGRATGAVKQVLDTMNFNKLFAINRPHMPRPS